MMQKLWAKLNPNKKRVVVVIVGVAGLFAVVSLFSGKSGQTHKPTNRQDTIRHVLTDRNTRDIGIDSLSADLKIVSDDNKTLRQELAQVIKELEQTKQDATSSNKVDQELTHLRQDLNTLLRQPDPANIKKTTPLESWAKPRGDDEAEQHNNDDPATLFQNAPVPTLLHQQDTAFNGGEGETVKPNLQIISHVEKPDESAKTESTSTQEEEIYLPAGALITGSLINGMDAPTNQGARREPFPATLRIDKEAILPNQFRADVRECFVVIGGYGDLSSERAYLRSETLSCVREDGGVIESLLDAYAVGEDGKAGVRGRLVSKQGQIIAKSMMAGFLGGLSKAFDINPIPAINTNPSNQTSYQSAFSNDLFQGAAVKGASQALDRIAQFYIDMAKDIFPVIEVDAGRQIDLIVTRGVTLQLRSKGAKK